MRYSIFPTLFLTLIITFSLTSIGAEAANSENPTEPEEIKANLEEAKRIYFDYYKDSMNLDRSIEILQSILEKDPKNLEAMLFLSRVWLTYGYAKAPNDKEKIRVFKNGMEAAKKAIGLAPDNPDAHSFYVANMGSWGATRGVLKSLFMLPKIRRELELILDLDPNHIYGLAMNGILYYTLPGFLGGDLYISEIYLKRAVRLDPHFTTSKIHLAENLIRQKKYDEAKKMLEEVVEEKNPTVYADWYIDKKIAMEMMTEIEKKNQKTPPSRQMMFLE